MKYQNKLFSKFLKIKTDEACKEYKRFRNRLTHIKETVKASCYKEELSKCGKSKSWKIINKLLRKTINQILFPQIFNLMESVLKIPFKPANRLINIVEVLEKIWRKISLKFHSIT